MSIKPIGFAYISKETGAVRVFDPDPESDNGYSESIAKLPVYAIPDTHRVVPVELLQTLVSVSYYKDAFMDACEEASAIIEDKP